MAIIPPHWDDILPGHNDHLVSSNINRRRCECWNEKNDPALIAQALQVPGGSVEDVFQIILIWQVAGKRPRRFHRMR